MNNQIYNINMLVKANWQPEDIVKAICEKTSLAPNEHFCFSAIAVKQKDGTHSIKFNSIVPFQEPNNSYTVLEIANKLFGNKCNTGKHKFDCDAYWVMPSLDIWLDIFAPMIKNIATHIFVSYSKSIQPEYDDVLGQVYLQIAELYNAHYYLSKSIIMRSMRNSYNKLYNKVSRQPRQLSIESCLEEQGDDNEITLADTIEDVDSTEWARQVSHYTQEDYIEDMYEKVSKVIEADIGEFRFKRLLIQLTYKSLQPDTINLLRKYRKLFNKEDNNGR